MVDMVEANSVIPLYKQIVRALSDSIANGTYRPGDKLPTEAELIEQFGVSRITVRSAIKEMEDAGLVERARGKGRSFRRTHRCMPRTTVRALPIRASLRENRRLPGFSQWAGTSQACETRSSWRRRYPKGIA